MKKIIALALALIMALSMASVAFAADYTVNQDTAPGEKILIDSLGGEKNAAKREWKVSYDFTSAKDDYKGVSMIDKIEITKDGDLELTLKENLTNTAEKEIKGLVTITHKTAYTLDANNKKVYNAFTYEVSGKVANTVSYEFGVKKAANATDLLGMAENKVMVVEEAGYATFTAGADLTGLVNLVKDEKAQVYLNAEIAEETQDAIDAVLGEDYEGIVEVISFGGTGFKNAVEFQYDAYAEDPHYFYAWDGEKFVDLEAKFNDDEDVEKYEFTAEAKGIIYITDVEIVAAAEETKNPDTGANDVVGVAAALAVVSLVAAGAVSLKK